MSRTHHPTWLLRVWPVLRWKNRVTAESVRSDLVSGLTVAIVVVPQAVAFASIAGMPPQYGLYAGMIPPIVAALFGSSWHLMSGPTTAASIMLLSALSQFAESTFRRSNIFSSRPTRSAPSSQSPSWRRCFWTWNSLSWRASCSR